ncbi:MAG: DUF1598 domain-containing protein [Hormoscilla sp. GM7CHS1pb]|nr:DUF1598 domain-containing protein [Hormoscilla sp. GM7CHS1pb]
MKKSAKKSAIASVIVAVFAIMASVLVDGISPNAAKSGTKAEFYCEQKGKHPETRVQETMAEINIIIRDLGINQRWQEYRTKGDHTLVDNFYQLDKDSRIIIPMPTDDDMKNKSHEQLVNQLKEILNPQLREAIKNGKKNVVEIHLIQNINSSRYFNFDDRQKMVDDFGAAVYEAIDDSVEIFKEREIDPSVQFDLGSNGTKMFAHNVNKLNEILPYTNRVTFVDGRASVSSTNQAIRIIGDRKFRIINTHKDHLAPTDSIGNKDAVLNDVLPDFPNLTYLYIKASNSENFSDHIASLTDRIDGYVIDNQDIILIGQADATKPPLHTEDFVVALRNTWFKYAKIEGNTRYYSYPTISIDPEPKVMSQLEKIGSVNLNKWHELCSQSQNVRVIGIPFNSHFAKTMVVPDYDMKKLVGGPDTHGISGLVSITEMSLIKIRSDLAEGKSNSMPISSLNRFWFTPGENLYQENEGVVIIEQSPVTLLTEEQFLSHKGELVGTKKADSLAQEFVENFTALYPEIASQRPIYAELENLFRFVALSKIMKFKNTLTDRAAWRSHGRFRPGLFAR